MGSSTPLVQVRSSNVHQEWNKGVFFEMILHLSVCRPSRIYQWRESFKQIYCTWSKTNNDPFFVCVCEAIGDVMKCWSHMTFLILIVSFQCLWRCSTVSKYFSSLARPNDRLVHLSQEPPVLKGTHRIFRFWLWWHINLARYQAKGRCRKIFVPVKFYIFWTIPEDVLSLPLGLLFVDACLVPSPPWL